MTDVSWDYSKRAKTFDKRANYDVDAINCMLQDMGCVSHKPVADIGAGTGKLTIPLLKWGLTVHGVEPNDNMRSIGIDNTNNLNVTWHKGTGEKTGLAPTFFQSVFFGSSFNVVNQKLALKEVKRLLLPHGWFACMWNHRDLNDPLQKEIESIIRISIPNYDYGTRRQCPSDIINASCLFGEIHSIEKSFSVETKTQDFVNAWKSHETLSRQSAGNFEKIIFEISKILPSGNFSVPYTTKIWYSSVINKKGDCREHETWTTIQGFRESSALGTASPA